MVKQSTNWYEFLSPLGTINILEKYLLILFFWHGHTYINFFDGVITHKVQ